MFLVRGVVRGIFPLAPSHFSNGKLSFLSKKNIKKHIFQTFLYKKHIITPASDPKQCVGGQQQKILYVSLRQPPNTRRRDKSQENCLQDICLCLLYTSYLKILCRSHVSDLCRSVHQ